MDNENFGDGLDLQVDWQERIKRDHNEMVAIFNSGPIPDWVRERKFALKYKFEFACKKTSSARRWWSLKNSRSIHLTHYPYLQMSLPDTVIISILEGQNPPAGATFLYYSLISCKRLMESPVGAKICGMLDGQILRAGFEEIPVISKTGELEM